MVEVGQKAPSFTLPDSDRKQTRLEDFRGKKTILAFFPGAFTGVCTKEMCTFRDSLSNLRTSNAQVVAVSVDSPWANKGFAQANNLTFPILSDYGRDVVKQYGIILKDFAGLKGYEVAKRSVFVLDEEGVVRYRWVSDDPTKEPDYQEVYRHV